MAQIANLTIDDDTQYRVQLAARVTVLGERLVPGQDITLRGDVLKTILTEVEDAEPV